MQKIVYNNKFKLYTKSYRKDILISNNYGIMSTSFSLVSYRQLECLRRFLSRRLHKKLKKRLKRRLCLMHSMFKKSKNSRMGKGIGKFYK